jgi:hypothetical protein
MGTIEETGCTLATRRNMRAFRDANPDREITAPAGGTITIRGRRCFAVSPTDPDERCSADAGDYFMIGEDEPLLDSCGEPMVLAVERCVLLDALTGESL